jgi:hypothetical protein
MTFILFYEESCAIFIFNRIFLKYWDNLPNNPFTIYLKFKKFRIIIFVPPDVTLIM